jgi:hypothetical protein
MIRFEDMIPAGYMAKQVSTVPPRLAAFATQIYSVSGCIAKPFCEFISHWQHNGFWLFDSPALIAAVARKEGMELTAHKMFYYEVYGQQSDEDSGSWQPVAADASIATQVLTPSHSRLEGFDVATFSAGTNPECSPLSCNYLAETIGVNKHCLLDSFDEAKRLLEAGAFAHSEPGPFRIFAVHSCPA